MRKAQTEEWLVHVLFYVGLILVLAVIVWALLTGKLNSLWSSLMDKMRFS